MSDNQPSQRPPPVASNRPPPDQLHPIFLRLAGKPVLVVGGGKVAEKKILDLVETSAMVSVVALDATETVLALADAGRIMLSKRAFTESDANTSWLVIAATSDPATQKRVCDEADRKQTFSIAIDDVPNGSAFSASVIRRGPVTVAISSSGEAPALSRLLREVIEQALPAEDWIDAARNLREKWKAEEAPMSSRFADLVRAFKDRASDK